MRPALRLMMLLVIVLQAGFLAWAADPVDSEETKIFKYLLAHRHEMSCVTPTPYHVFTSNFPGLCAAPVSGPPSANPHHEHWIHVFVSPAGKTAMTTGKGAYPAGTMILKQKFLDADGKNTEFYTGMRKRERGYNPAVGDWEFFTLDSAGQKVTARGKIDSCIDCHAKYKSTDFVSGRYLTSKPGADW